MKEGSLGLRLRGEYPKILNQHHKRHAGGQQGARHKKYQYVMK